MEKYVPDIYQKSIYTINYDKLLERGIKCLLFDLDNTIVSVNTKNVNNKTKDLFNDLREKKIEVFIFSNTFNKRVKQISDQLGVEYYHFVRKPSPKGFLKVMKAHNYTISEIAIIGDQLLTDIKGGNKVGITTILVNPISKKDGFFTKFNRLREGDIYKKLGKNNLVLKGKYYE